MNNIKENSFILHQNYGLGKICIFENNEIYVDFSEGKEIVFSKKEFEESYLKNEIKEIPEDSFSVVSKFFKDKLLKIVNENPVEVLELLIKDGITLFKKANLHSALVNAFIEEEKWESWWKTLQSKTKDILKFRIKDKETITLREDINKDIISRLNAAYSFESKKEIFKEFIELLKKNFDLNEAKKYIKDSLNSIIESHLENISKRFEGILFLKQIEDIEQKQEKEIGEYIDKNHQQFLKEILNINPKEFISEISQLKTVKYKMQFLDLLKYADIERYLSTLSFIINSSKDLRDYALMELISFDKFDKVSSEFNNIINEYKIDEELFIWACKTLFNNKINIDKLEIEWLKIYNNLFNILSEVEVIYDMFKRDEYEHSGLKKKKEKEILNLLSKIEILKILLKKNDLKFARTIALYYKETNAFGYETKEKIFNLVKEIHPEINLGDKENFIGVEKTHISDEALKKLKEEYEELINIKIPSNTEEIKKARAWGDISENAEFHAAKEKQAELEGRKKYLESILFSQK